MGQKNRNVGIIGIAIGLIAASRGASELLEVGRNVDVLALFIGGAAIGAGLVTLLRAIKDRA